MIEKNERKQVAKRKLVRRRAADIADEKLRKITSEIALGVDPKKKEGRE